MMHPSLRPLHSLLERAEHERDEARQAQRRAASALGAAQSQQAQLSGYRREYEQRWSAQLSGGVTMTLMQCYLEFRERLMGAVDLQQQQIDRLEADLQTAQAGVIEAERRVAAVRKLIERRADAILRKDQRSEQRQQDEFAARLAWQQRLAGPGGAWPSA